MVPLSKIKEALLRVDEVQLLELLDLKTSDILERFEDVVIKRKSYLTKELEFIDDEPYKELNFD